MNICCRHLLAMAIGLALIAQSRAISQPRVEYHMAVVKITIDSGDAPLGAYQFQIRDPNDEVQFVGVENGEHPAYRKAPYYDSKEMSRSNRLIVAAYSIADDLPTGPTRVATIHVVYTKPNAPELIVDLVTTTDANGNEIPARIQFDVEKE